MTGIRDKDIPAVKYKITERIEDKGEFDGKQHRK